MNNILAEFASIQVEAIDGVLEMVARDRRRVEALLAQVESPSLRQYLQQWLDATPTPVVTEETEPDNDNDELKSISLSEEEEEEQEEVCCARNCWNDPTVSFWHIFQHRPNCARALVSRSIQRHHAMRTRLAYGVSYEWVTETTNISDGFPEGFSHGRWDWEDEDHYFEGRNVCPGSNQALEDIIESQYMWRHMMAPGEFHRSALIPEDDKGLMSSIFEEQPGCLPTVEQVKQAGGAIYYDLVFIAAELSDVVDRELITILRDHRTAKGTLTLHASHGHLTGTIELDPSIHGLDAMPFEENTFHWKETNRLERIASSRSHSSSDWTHNATNVLFVRGKVNDEEATGEVRIIRRRIACFREDEPLVDHCSTSTLELAEQMMQKHRQMHCSWMYRHTALPVEVIKRIGDFVSPPPVFYLEPGDLTLDMDWGPAILSCLQRNNNTNELPHTDLMSLATVVARPRR